MTPAGIEITIAASERPQTHALERAATGIGCCVSSCAEILIALCCCNSRLPCWFGIFFCVHALRVCISDKRRCSYLRHFCSSSVFHFPVLRSYCQLSLSTLFPSASNVRFTKPKLHVVVVCVCAHCLHFQGMEVHRKPLCWNSCTIHELFCL